MYIKEQVRNTIRVRWGWRSHSYRCLWHYWKVFWFSIRVDAVSLPNVYTQHIVCLQSHHIWVAAYHAPQWIECTFYYSHIVAVWSYSKVFERYILHKTHYSCLPEHWKTTPRLTTHTQTTLQVIKWHSIFLVWRGFFLDVCWKGDHAFMCYCILLKSR